MYFMGKYTVREWDGSLFEVRAWRRADHDHREVLIEYHDGLRHIVDTNYFVSICVLPERFPEPIGPVKPRGRTRLSLYLAARRG